MPGVLDRSGQSTAVLSESNGLPVLNYSASLQSASVDAAESLANGHAVPFNVWIDGSFVLHRRPSAGGAFSLNGIGADYLLNDSLLIGVAAYVDWMRDIGALTNVEGYGGLVGPYLSLRLGDNASFDVSLFYGKSWNESVTAVFGQTFSGSFTTDRLVGKAILQGEFLLDQITLRPDATLFLSHESAGDYVIRNAAGTPITVPGTAVAEFRLSADLAIERSFELVNGLDLTPMLAVRGGTSSDGLNVNWSDVFGTVSGGVKLSGANWSVEGMVEGTAQTDGLEFGGVRGRISGHF